MKQKETINLALILLVLAGLSPLRAVNNRKKGSNPVAYQPIIIIYGGNFSAAVLSLRRSKTPLENRFIVGVAPIFNLGGLSSGGLGFTR